MSIVKDEKDVFDNDLIRKYFPCSHAASMWGCAVQGCFGYSAEAILKAMTEPIRPGDKYLDRPMGDWIELTLPSGQFYSATFHGSVLRIPDQFQKPDLVEEKITEINNCLSFRGIEPHLRELVRLARENK